MHATSRGELRRLPYPHTIMRAAATVQRSAPQQIATAPRRDTGDTTTASDRVQMPVRAFLSLQFQRLGHGCQSTAACGRRERAGRGKAKTGCGAGCGRGRLEHTDADQSRRWFPGSGHGGSPGNPRLPLILTRASMLAGCRAVFWFRFEAHVPGTGQDDLTAPA